MKREIMNAIEGWTESLSRRGRFVITSLVILVTWATSGAYPGLARESAEQTFSSPADASQNLFQAVAHDSVQAIANVLGGPTELASCGDEAQEKADRELFVQKYRGMHRLGRQADGTMTLYIGAENWPFPIPLVEKDGGWRFDSDAGLREVLFRRIGENELTAMAICHEFVAAEKDYRAVSNIANPADSFPRSLVAEAAGESASHDHVLLHGYYFQVLAFRPTNVIRPTSEGKPTGGFALIAYPTDYRSACVMTFIITENDVVYEKDIGANTSALASAMTTFHIDATWHAAGE